MLEKVRIHPDYHALMLACDGGNRTAYAIVVIFGALFYLVQLTEDYRGADFPWTYVYNAQTGEETTILVRTAVNELAIVQDVLRGPTRWDDAKASAECLIHYVSQVRPDVKIEPDS